MSPGAASGAAASAGSVAASLVSAASPATTCGAIASAVAASPLDVATPAACAAAPGRSAKLSAGGAFGSEKDGGMTMSAGSGPASLMSRLKAGSRSRSSVGHRSLFARSAALMSGSTLRSARNRLTRM